MCSIIAQHEYIMFDFIHVCRMNVTLMEVIKITWVNFLSYQYTHIKQNLLEFSSVFASNSFLQSLPVIVFFSLLPVIVFFSLLPVTAFFNLLPVIVFFSLLSVIAFFRLLPVIVFFTLFFHIIFP